MKIEYAREVRILEQLNSRDLGVLIPKITLTDERLDYLVYDGVEGETLDLVIKRLDEDTKRDIGRKIGEFLKVLHSINIQDVRDFPVREEIMQFQAKYKLSLPVIGQEFTEEQRSVLERFYLSELPEALKGLGEKPTLCHGDLGLWNMVYTPDGDLGIIDFGDIGFYDTSKDFIGLSDPAMQKAALEAYGYDENLVEKIKIRQKALPILDIPYFSGKNNTEGLENTLKKLREKFNFN